MNKCAQKLTPCTTIASASQKQAQSTNQIHLLEHMTEKYTKTSLSVKLQNHISLNTMDHFKQANAHWKQHEVDYHKQVIILRKGWVENPT